MLTRRSKNSNHLYGNALDIHGSSQTWMRANGKKYGWNINDYGDLMEVTLILRVIKKVVL
jgi:hypothetical protein